MGKIFQGIFGGSKSKQTSQSNNQAYPYLQGAYGGQVSNGTGANDFVSQLLGLKGGDEANQAFDKYKDSTGYQFALDSGSKAITGNAASRGLLSSGSTAQALTKFGQNNATQYYNSYLDKLLGLSGQGLQAGGLIGGAGQQSSSKGTSSTKPGIGGFLGSILSGGMAGG